MTAISGALGSVIGYLGGEAAEPGIFERLLWPQRFYNDIGLFNLLKICIFMPMGGPVHSAALKTLDKFRDNGLYYGSHQGNFLGTGFYPDSRMKYHHRSGSDPTKHKDVRNGLWLEVLLRVRPHIAVKPAVALDDDEDKGEPGKPFKPRRTIQLVYHLQLRGSNYMKAKKLHPDAVFVQEDKVLAWRVLLGVFASELSSLGLAISLGVYEHLDWLAVYLCVPLLFKFLAVLCSIIREDLEEIDDEETTTSQIEIFEIDMADHNYMIIESPARILLQFFRHYGHPRRSRWSEISSILLVYGFVLYFPAGLVSLLWMDPTIQYIWLGYQIYAIMAMHILRLLGATGIGRTEERIARALGKDEVVVLVSKQGKAVVASLSWTAVNGVAEGRNKTIEIVRNHRERIEVAGNQAVV